MDRSNKRIVSNTLTLYFRQLLTMGVGLYTSRIVLNTLGVDDYGIYNVVGGIIILFSFVNGALGSATSRYITFELGRDNQRYLNEIFRSAFTIHLLLAFLVFLFAETLGLWFVNYKMMFPVDRMFSVNVIYQFFVLSCIIMITQVPLNAEIIAHERMNIYAYIGIVDAVIKLLIAYFLSIYEGNRLILYGLMLLVTTVLLYLFYHIYCKKNFVEYNVKPLFKQDIFRKMLSYSGWSLWGSLAYVSKDQGANILLNMFFGPAVNASRGIAYQINSAINSFTQNFTMAMNPQVIKSYASNDLERVLFLLFRGAKFSCFLMFFFSIPILIEASFILEVWLIDVPEYTVIFSRLVIVNSLFESFTYVIGATVQATGRIKWYQMIVGGILLVNLPLSFLFLKLGYPPYITLIISVGISFISLIVRLIILRILINISVLDFLIRVIGLSMLVGALSAIPPLIVANCMSTGALRFFLVTIISFLSIIFFILLMGLNKKEKKKLHILVMRQINRLK